MIEVGVAALLANDPAVAALVANRISPLVLPVDPQFPAITYESMTSQSDVLLSGEIGEQTERIRIKCCSLSYLEAGNLAQAVHDLLDTWKGTLSDGTVAQVIERVSGNDFFLSDQRIYGKTIDFIFFY